MDKTTTVRKEHTPTVIRRQHAMLGLPNFKLTEAEWIETLEKLEGVRYVVPELTLEEFLERARPEKKSSGNP